MSYNFETYEGDDDFLLSKIMERDDVNELLLEKSIPELWQLIQIPQDRGGEVSEERKTVVVNKYAEDFDVDIMRPSLWGNPFRIGRDGTREEVLQKFLERTKELPHLIELAKEKLRGKVLGCCCKPQACHGDIWVRLIEGESGEKE